MGFTEEVLLEVGEEPELVSALNGLLDVVMALEPVGVACVAVAAAKAARFCMALRPDRHTHIHTWDRLESLMTNLADRYQQHI